MLHSIVLLHQRFQHHVLLSPVPWPAITSQSDQDLPSLPNATLLFSSQSLIISYFGKICSNVVLLINSRDKHAADMFKNSLHEEKSTCSHTLNVADSGAYLQPASLSEHQLLCCYEHKDNNDTCSPSPNCISLYQSGSLCFPHTHSLQTCQLIQDEKITSGRAFVQAGQRITWNAVHKTQCCYQ